MKRNKKADNLITEESVVPSLEEQLCSMKTEADAKKIVDRIYSVDVSIERASENNSQYLTKLLLMYCVMKHFGHYEENPIETLLSSVQSIEEHDDKKFHKLADSGNQYAKRLRFYQESFHNGSAWDYQRAIAAASYKLTLFLPDIDLVKDVDLQMEIDKLEEEKNMWCVEEVFTQEEKERLFRSKPQCKPSPQCRSLPVRRTV